MMRFILQILLLVVVACSLPAVSAAHNPFMKKGQEAPAATDAPAEEMESESVDKPSPFGDGDSKAQEEAYVPSSNPIRQLFGKLLPLQRDLHRKLSRAIREANRDGAGTGGLLALLGGAFLYGLVHALGPGHGKSVASAYFLSRGGRKRHGIYMGMTTALVHAASAIVTVLLLKFVLETTMGGGLEGAVDRISQVSFLCIALIGFVMLVLAVRQWSNSSGHAPVEQPASRGGFLKMAAISGVVPCPGAAIILFFSLALDVPGLGVLAVVAMSLGMGVTISAAGILTLAGRGALLKVSGQESRYGWVGNLLSVLGALLIMLLGLLFFWAAFP